MRAIIEAPRNPEPVDVGAHHIGRSFCIALVAGCLLLTAACARAPGTDWGELSRAVGRQIER